ncbi:hypothetical protein [uncultured Massilia sp.]|uniref:hypothetical protein n=1 Tax=uncultured Massilia sp. TaxID=169973 RepID=UPI00258DEB15|nr:hypothetical protein [uncultured Massilia sp.]
MEIAMSRQRTGPRRRHFLSRLPACLIAWGLLSCHSAQAAPDYLKLLDRAETASGAPGVFAQLETLAPEARAAVLEERAGALDMLRNMRSLAGDASGAAQASMWFDIARDVQSQYGRSTSLALESATAEDALAAIVREAKNRQIVILNEAHHVPFHRVFAARLARELRKIGYDYLAAEAFTPDIPLHPATVDRNMGFYVNEPMYGAFVRGAIRDGWSFVGYDHNPEGAQPHERERLRELGSARNLVERIFTKHPKAKVFMYVGYGHAGKQGVANKDGWKSVATLLREQLGIDPLSIEQTFMYARDDARVEHPRYRAAMERFAPSLPVVFRTPAGGYAMAGVRPGSYDMQVFHPDETEHGKEGRPVWMQTRAGLAPQPVPANLLPAQGRRLIQAFHADDGPDATPLDMVMVEAGKPAPALMLPPGTFRFGFAK